MSTSTANDKASLSLSPRLSNDQPIAITTNNYNLTVPENGANVKYKQCARKLHNNKHVALSRTSHSCGGNEAPITRGMMAAVAGDANNVKNNDVDSNHHWKSYPDQTDVFERATRIVM